MVGNTEISPIQNGIRKVGVVLNTVYCKCMHAAYVKIFIRVTCLKIFTISFKLVYKSEGIQNNGMPTGNQPMHVTVTCDLHDVHITTSMSASCNVHEFWTL